MLNMISNHLYELHILSLQSGFTEQWRIRLQTQIVEQISQITLLGMFFYKQQNNQRQRFAEQRNNPAKLNYITLNNYRSSTSKSRAETIYHGIGSNNSATP